MTNFIRNLVVAGAVGVVVIMGDEPAIEQVQAIKITRRRAMAPGAPAGGQTPPGNGGLGDGNAPGAPYSKRAGKRKARVPEGDDIENDENAAGQSESAARKARRQEIFGEWRAADDGEEGGEGADLHPAFTSGSGFIEAGGDGTGEILTEEEELLAAGTPHAIAGGDADRERVSRGSPSGVKKLFK